MMFDCVYLELSASLEHGINELLEAAVRTARGDCVGPGWTDGDPAAGRRESLTSRAKRFLAGLVPRSNSPIGFTVTQILTLQYLSDQ
ncbi:hypothetical protein XENOCAPTIV_015094 [Xenoophorus captivus]|uniref:Uncharacterized protein n=1 Tax=Xenoophorus captivus TaxID=1517983 RepID=A0ABV0Q5T2_9TELE